MTDVILESPKAAWSELLRSALERLSLELSEDVSAYLLGTLYSYSVSPRRMGDRVAIMYLEAQHYQRHERFIRLQEVGDICLLAAGFFPRVSRRRTVSASYYHDMGQNAYGEAARALESHRSLFRSLSARFVDIAESLRSFGCTQPIDLAFEFDLFTQTEALLAGQRLRESLGDKVFLNCASERPS